ncbi:hypothetical protein CSL77_002022 [Salmonella enterica subsp. diarizonae]|uniref:Uncharacterized protein n=1 Tax=Salmonella diarizonae TaxID=59204 RepID=A0A3R0AWC5_SALDZ|nr:hypothetical protein [Salmonella enterica]AXC67737.1 hypothetical protein DOE63_20870 [Salmonella enterica subsp. diarizonae serovar 59:z10:-]EAA2773760.1 hypothetical protein [Salmonella enterica subsp. diarizonae]HCM1873717.1 hypothetical protein [Salmonella enterica subsp. diarizonae serovar 53:z10:z35]EAP0942146.1 hypothetical protein [Salmonella enterica]EAP3676294.1 hypothetical protein [Salmonella enterica]
MAITLARKLAKIAWFICLFYIGLRIIYPENLISLYTSERFAQWVYGYSSQENFDDLWVLIWGVCSFAFAVVGHLFSMWIIKKMRR